MITIQINRKYYSIPQEWNELSQQQLLAVIKVLYLKNYPIEKALLKLLKILTGMTWWEFFRAPVTTTERFFFSWRPRLSLAHYLFFNRHTCYGLDEYLYLCEFLVTTNKLTRQLIPFYKDFYGPSDGCNNMRMNEFVFTEHFYMEWKRLQEDPERSDDAIKALDNLVAILYRPRKKKYNLKMNKDGDCRIAFNENLCEYFATSQIYRWPLQVKLAICNFYEASRNQWIEENQDVFGGNGEPAKYGLLSVMRGVAKSGTHGTFEMVEQKHVSLILIELNELVAESKELEKLTNK